MTAANTRNQVELNERISTLNESIRQAERIIAAFDEGLNFNVPILLVGIRELETRALDFRQQLEIATTELTELHTRSGVAA